jgi:hypothetical protein
MTAVYEKMARMMVTTHTEMTVFCLYPIPNGRNVPSELYANAGFAQWNAPNKTPNNSNANMARCVCTIFLNIISGGCV